MSQRTGIKKALARKVATERPISMPEKPKILRTRTLAQTRVFHVEELELAFSNGRRARFERIAGSAQGAVLVVPMQDEDTVLLIREYAAAMDRYELGLPKGSVESGEDLLETANREIMEEVGFGARELRHIRSLTIAPGYLDHCTHLILARDLYPARRGGDEPEELEVVPWSLKNLAELLEQPDFTEARSIAALFLIREMLAGEPNDDHSTT